MAALPRLPFSCTALGGSTSRSGAGSVVGYVADSVVGPVVGPDAGSTLAG